MTDFSPTTLSKAYFWLGRLYHKDGFSLKIGDFHSLDNC